MELEPVLHLVGKLGIGPAVLAEDESRRFAVDSTFAILLSAETPGCAFVIHAHLERIVTVFQTQQVVALLQDRGFSCDHWMKVSVDGLSDGLAEI